MRSGLSRFAVVGSLATAVDVVSFVVFWRGAGLPIAVADVPALVAAAFVSYASHRAITFRNDPYDRWLHRPRDFAISAVAAGVVDLAVVAFGAALVAPAALLSGTIAKFVAVAVAGTVRWVLHRRVLFAIVRSEQVARPGRARPPGRVRLSVVIPAYGEEERIGTTITRIRDALQSVADSGGLEIVVVDDGSTDGTADAARAAGADQVLVQSTNGGKGAAVRRGMLAATGRTLAFTDADLAYSPDQILNLLDEIERGWDMVVGSRRHAGAATLVRARRIRELGGRAINWLTHAVLLGHYRDTQCGLKAFRSDAAHTMFSRSRIDGFAFDVELFVMAERMGLALVEVPARVENTTRSTVKVVRDAYRLIRDLFRIRRWARDGLYEPGPHPALVNPPAL